MDVKTYKIRVVPYDSQDNCDLIYVNKRYNDFGELYDDVSDLSLKWIWRNNFPINFQKRFFALI